MNGALVDCAMVSMHTFRPKKLKSRPIFKKCLHVKKNLLQLVKLNGHVLAYLFPALHEPVLQT